MIKYQINWYGLLFAAIACLVFILLDLRWGWGKRGRDETY